MMDDKLSLENLNFTQLHLLLDHLRLGTAHLKNILSPKQFYKLLYCCQLSEEQIKQIETDKAEKMGNIALIVNTIVTSTFGAWMGLSGCIGCKLNSINILSLVISLAFFVSAIIGYISFRSTHNQAKQALENQKLHNLQLYLLQLINSNLDAKLKREMKYLNTAIFLLETKKETSNQQEGDMLAFNSSPEASAWIDHFKRILRERIELFNYPTAYSLCKSELNKITRRLYKTLFKHIHFLENLSLNKDKKFSPPKNLDHYSFIEVLTNPALAIPKVELKYSSWIKNNVGTLIMGLAPTLFGGFASMFVFVGGIPNISKEFGFLSLADFLTTPIARTVELFMAASMTLYFGFSYLHSTRKMMQRKALLEKTHYKISEEDSLLLEKNHKFKVLLQMKSQIQKVISIFNVLKKIDDNLSKTAYSEKELLPVCPATGALEN